MTSFLPTFPALHLRINRDSRTRGVNAYLFHSLTKCSWSESEFTTRKPGRNLSPTFLSIHIIWYDRDHTKNTASNNSYIAACVFVATGTCLPRRCLARPSLLAPLLRLRGDHRHRHSKVITQAFFSGYFPNFVLFSQNKKRCVKEHANKIKTEFTSMELLSFYCVALTFQACQWTKFPPLFRRPSWHADKRTCLSPSLHVYLRCKKKKCNLGWRRRKHNTKAVLYSFRRPCVSTLNPIILWHANPFCGGQTKSQDPVNCISFLKQVNDNNWQVSSNWENQLFCKCVPCDVGRPVMLIT
jgi:hypothetical protein